MRGERERERERADLKHTIVVSYGDNHSIWVENVEWIVGGVLNDHFKLTRSFQFRVINGFYFDFISRHIA